MYELNSGGHMGGHLNSSSDFDQGDSSTGNVVARQGNALTRREEQLRRWEESDTYSDCLTTASAHRATDGVKPVKGGRSVNFPDGIVFLAVCASGDKDDIVRLITKGADINTANVDGLTALHQACIDDNLEMVKFLIDSGVDLDFCDNEGWTPLHATASCSYVEIAKCLMEHGARVACCNNDGDLPVDIAASTEMREILEAEMEKEQVDAQAAKRVEEDKMLEDAREWLSNKCIAEQKHVKSGASALHVAAAKGYLQVMQLLLQTGVDVNSLDNDGWTPLHAAAHWGQNDAAQLLVLEANVDMEKTNLVGQTAFDVADSDMVAFLEDLRDKQQQKIDAIDTTRHDKIHRGLLKDETRRSSVTRLSIEKKDQKKKMEAVGSLENSVDEDEDDDDDNDEQDNSPEKTLSPPLRPASITLPVGGASSGNPTVGTVTPMIRPVNGRPASVPQPNNPPTFSAPDPWQCFTADGQSITTSSDPPSAQPSAQTRTTPPVPSTTSSEPPISSKTAVVSPETRATQPPPPFAPPPKRDAESETIRMSNARRARGSRRSTQGVTPEIVAAAIAENQNLTTETTSAPETTDDSDATDAMEDKPSSISLKHTDSLSRIGRRIPRHDTQDSISSNSSSASSGSGSSTSSTLTAGSVAAASPKFERSQRFSSSGSACVNPATSGGGDGVGVTPTSPAPPPALVVTGSGDAPASASPSDGNSDSGLLSDGGEDKGSGSTAGGLDPDSAYKRSSAIIKRKLRAQRRSTGIAFDEEEKKEGNGEGGDEEETAEVEGAPPSSSEATTTTTTRYYRSSGSTSSSTSTTSNTKSPSASESPRSSATPTPAPLGGLSANTCIADRYARPTASATTYRQAAELDYKKLYDEEKQENERLRLKLARVDRELAEQRLQVEKNQRNLQSGNNNSFGGGSVTTTTCVGGSPDGVLRDRQNLERSLAETLEELKMLEQLKADNMRLKEENGALIRVISKLSK